MCREVGGRVATNLLARHGPRGALTVLQFVVDTTLVSVVQGDGQQRGIKQRCCGSIVFGKRRNHIAPKLCVQKSSTFGGFGPGWRQVVSGSQDFCAVVGASKGEVGATSDATADGAGVALALALGLVLCCSVASLLELRGGHGPMQVPPAHDVECEQLYAGLCG